MELIVGQDCYPLSSAMIQSWHLQTGYEFHLTLETHLPITPMLSSTAVLQLQQQCLPVVIMQLAFSKTLSACLYRLIVKSPFEHHAIETQYWSESSVSDIVKSLCPGCRVRAPAEPVIPLFAQKEQTASSAVSALCQWQQLGFRCSSDAMPVVEFFAIDRWPLAGAVPVESSNTLALSVKQTHSKTLCIEIDNWRWSVGQVIQWQDDYFVICEAKGGCVQNAASTSVAADHANNVSYMAVCYQDLASYYPVALPQQYGWLVAKTSRPPEAGHPTHHYRVCIDGQTESTPALARLTPVRHATSGLNWPLPIDCRVMVCWSQDFDRPIIVGADSQQCQQAAVTERNPHAMIMRSDAGFQWACEPDKDYCQFSTPNDNQYVRFDQAGIHLYSNKRMSFQANDMRVEAKQDIDIEATQSHWHGDKLELVAQNLRVESKRCELQGQEYQLKAEMIRWQCNQSSTWRCQHMQWQISEVMQWQANSMTMVASLFLVDESVQMTLQSGSSQLTLGGGKLSITAPSVIFQASQLLFKPGCQTKMKIPYP